VGGGGPEKVKKNLTKRKKFGGGRGDKVPGKGTGVNGPGWRTGR